MVTARARAGSRVGGRTLDREEGRLPPIAVDLDGTLIRSDALHEALIDVLRWRLADILALVVSLAAGKAAFKRRLATRVRLDVASLPYDPGLVSFLRDAAREGRRIGLFTASDQSVAEQIGDHLALFDVVRGSDGRTNLCGVSKAAAIRETFGDRFSYAGDSAVDRPVFAAAQSVVLVGDVDGLRAHLPPAKIVEAVFPRPRPGPRTWGRALRLQHWVKNVLVFVAPILGFEVDAPRIVAGAILLFVLLGMLASATYLLNDMVDLATDRRHPEKRTRPFAAGKIALRDGVVAAAVLIGLAGTLSLMLPLAATAALALYFGLTSAYSLFLKRAPMVDVVTLAALFTLRVWAGGTLLPTPTSPWLLTFSMLFFLGLAMIKRYAELERVARTGAGFGRARGYSARDLPILLATGVASGLSAIVIFMVYLINEQYPRHIYTYPAVLWGIMPVLLVWTLRVWHLSVHGRMNEDPVVFALKDRVSLALGAVVALLLLVAWI